MPGIEVLADDAFVAAFYEWDVAPVRADLPELTRADLDDLHAVAVELARPVPTTCRTISAAQPPGPMGPTGASKRGRREPRFVQLSEVRPRELDFLWHGYLPDRAITVVQGDGREYKTTLLCDLAARVTVGAPAPLSDKPMPQGNVLIISGEDEVGSVLRRRIQMAGGDLDRVFVLEESDQNEDDADLQPLSIPYDVRMIANFCRERAVRWVLIDPLMDFLDDDVNSRGDHSMRRALRSLRNLGLPCALVRHLVKSRRTGSRLVHQGSGGIAIAALARSVLHVEGGVLQSAKLNVGVRPPALRFEFVPEGPGSGFGRIEWIGTVEPDSTSAPLTQAERAEVFLRAQLANGPVAATVLMKRATDAGIGDRTVEDVKAQLGIESWRPRKEERGGRYENRWYWRWPTEACEAVDPTGQRSPAVFHGPDAAAENQDEPHHGAGGGGEDGGLGGSGN